jgi:tRNA(Phe) wybutosine-synthesizing methylase Tyw3
LFNVMGSKKKSWSLIALVHKSHLLAQLQNLIMNVIMRAFMLIVTNPIIHVHVIF